MDQIVLNSSEQFAEGIRVISRPLDTDMGVAPLTPFVLSVSAETSNYEDLAVSLYVGNSNSIPYTSDLDNNYSALKPQWRFLDSSGNYIEEQTAINFQTEILDENGDVRGGVGTATFYYIDDLPSEYGCPAMIQATVDTLNYYDKDYAADGTSVTSYYNSEMKIIVPFYVYPIKPSFLHFSKNGSIDLYDRQWAGNNIKAYATIHGVPRTKFLSYTQCAIDYPILFNLPNYAPSGDTNTLYYSMHPLSGSEVTPSGSPSVEFDLHSTADASYTGGFAEVNMTSWVECAGAILSGTTSIEYDPDDYYTDTTSEFWVSNQKSNKLHKLESIYIDTSASCVSGLYDTSADKMSNNVFNTGFSVPFYDTSYYDAVTNANILSNAHELSGYSGIYGIAIDGSSNVWSVDFELDRIYKRDSAGELLFTVDLQLLPSGDIAPPAYDSEYTWYGPSSISLDSVGNAYVSLYNAPSGMKINSNGTIAGYFSAAFSESFGVPISSSEDGRISPIDIEIDSSDGINYLFTNNYFTAVQHVDSTTLVQDYSWTTADPTYRSFDMVYRPAHGGLSERFFISMSDGVYRLIKNVGSYNTPQKYVTCTDPSYITIDAQYNIWFAFDGNKVGYIDGGATSPVGTSFDYFELSGNNLTDDIIGGLGCDASGFVNVLDKYKNVVYRVNASEFISTGIANPFGVKILPEDDYIVVNDDGVISEIEATTDQPVDSLYAYGDWTGLSWQLKFGTTSLSANTIVELEGSSSLFEINSLQNEYDLRRYNDSWDMKAQINSYILPDYQKEFTSLWDDLIGNIVGDDAEVYQTFGRQFYEKIANFVLNHSDIDLANIDQVYSLFDMLGRQYDNYNFNYPADLKHWMNILSITYERLKGTAYPCNRNFKPAKHEDIEACEVCGQIHPSNMGDEILAPTMTVGEPVVIRDTYLSSNAFDVFYPPLSGSFEQLSDYGFRSPFATNYEVYEYVETVSPNAQSEGFINWADEHNKLAISGTSSTDWWKDGGYVENTFAQILYEGLFPNATTYVTDVQSVQYYTLNNIAGLTTESSSLFLSGSVASEYFIPFKLTECSPIAGYSLPFYSTTSSVTSTAITIPSGSTEISSGVAPSIGYLEIPIGDETYYAPTYVLDPIIFPVIGSCVSFEGSVIVPEFTIESSGFLVFEKDSDTVLLPVYQAKSDSDTTTVESSDPFTIVHIGDTQLMVQDAAAGDTLEQSKFENMIQWIIDNEESENIQMVIHAGDIVENAYHNPITSQLSAEYIYAQGQLSGIDAAGIPLILAPGNHDNINDNTYSGSNWIDTTAFNQYFPDSRFTSESWYLGQYESGKSENAYYKLDYAGINYIVIAMEYEPRKGVVEWADQICKDNPDAYIIVSTHHYLDDVNDTDAPNDNTQKIDDNWYLNNTYYGDEITYPALKRYKPTEVWDNLITSNPNIILVLCGHNHDWTGYLQSVGSYGQLVNQIQNDYSKIFWNQPSIRDQYKKYRDAIMLIRVDPATKTATTSVYSDYINSTEPATSGWISGGKQNLTFKFEPTREEEY